YAATRVNAPSSSRIFVSIWFAMYIIDSFGMTTFSSSHFFFKIAILVSKSGSVMSVVSPHPMRERNLSSKVGISLGGRSLVFILFLLKTECHRLIRRRYFYIFLEMLQVCYREWSL